MAKMRAIEAAVHVLRKEGIDTAFGVPGAAINPIYAAMKTIGGIQHYLARHVEGASHMAEGYTRTNAGNIGVCIGTSGPAGTDMVTGLYSASADSIPILCITGQAPTARLHKEDFQAIDITNIVAPVTKWATTVLEPAQVPGAFQRAFYEMRTGRPGPVLIDLPFDVADVSAPTIHAPLTSVLVRTGLWRTMRPVIDRDRCKRCWWVCSTFCPDDSISVTDDGRPLIDYDTCKGCMICVAQCPPHAIEAVAEATAAADEESEAS